MLIRIASMILFLVEAYNWASTREALSSGFASAETDLCLCHSLFGNYHIRTMRGSTGGIGGPDPPLPTPLKKSQKPRVS